MVLRKVIVFLGCVAFLNGCGSYNYEGSRDTVEMFGDGRYQVAEVSGSRHCIDDAKTKKIVVESIDKWKQSGGFAYAVGGYPFSYIVIDLSTNTLMHYATISKVPQKYQPIFKSLTSN
jgi:hypothetical protein